MAYEVVHDQTLVPGYTHSIQTSRQNIVALHAPMTIVELFRVVTSHSLVIVRTNLWPVFDYL